MKKKREWLDVTAFHTEAEKIAVARRRADPEGSYTWQSVMRECIAGGLTLLKDLCDES